MCILALPVRSVRNTRIFVGTNTEGDRQLTVYEMAVELVARRQAANSTESPGNAMILPVPAGAPEQIDLIDMTEAKDFFDGLETCFQPMTLGLKSRSRGMSNGFLEVHQVGSYNVSIANTYDELDLINPAVFTLSADAKQVLGSQYSRLNGPKFCFVVAQLRESGKFHPLAFSHPIAEDGKLFIPTKHEHGLKIPGVSEESLRGRAVWDHHIFHQSTATYDEQPRSKDRTERVGNQNRYGQIKNTLAHWAEKVPALAPYFDISEDCRLARTEFKGVLKNIDLRLPVAA